jgi:parvulin-like peptidyl-prolyl isomerase
VIGALTGLGLAALGLLDPTWSHGLPPDAIARVNDAFLRRDDYARALAGVAADRRAPLSEADRRHVLDRLIDEELLVQHALELDLARLDRRVRTDLVAAMIQYLAAGAEDRDPTPAELRSFLEENADRFARPGRIRLRRILIRSEPLRTDEEARERAALAFARIRSGEAFDRIRSDLGDEEIAPLPDSFLSPTKLREHLGDSLAREAMALEVGRVSEPLRSAAGYHVLQIVAREPRRQPDSAHIDEDLRAEWRREQQDRALRRELDRLREMARIERGLPGP